MIDTEFMQLGENDFEEVQNRCFSLELRYIILEFCSGFGAHLC